MEKRKANYLIKTVRRGGKGKQQFKTIVEHALTVEDARRIAKRLSQEDHYGSTVIFDQFTNLPIEFWNHGNPVQLSE